MKRSSSFLAACLFTLASILSGATHGQTTLAAGDLVVVGSCFNGNMMVYWAPLVDLDAGTTIYFTDCGWLSAGGFKDVNNDGAVAWTNLFPIVAGTVIEMNISTLSASYGNVNIYTGSTITKAAGPNFSNSSDQVIVFQGSDASPTLLFAINAETSGSAWDANATNHQTSAQPPCPNVCLNAVNNCFDQQYVGDKTYINSVITNPLNWNGGNINASSSCTPYANASVLPLVLYSFSIESKADQVLINWELENADVAGFEVFYSGDGQKFDVVGTTPYVSSGVYQFAHSPTVAGTHYYQVGMRDYTGSLELSDILSITLSQTDRWQVRVAGRSCDIVAQGATTIRATSVRLFATTGQQQLLAQGERSLSLNLATLPVGIYTLLIQDETGYYEWHTIPVF